MGGGQPSRPAISNSSSRNLEARGTKVHWAGTAQQARDLILGILRAKNARVIVKSKAMTSEEIHLNEAMEQAGYEVVESDLGEFIVQLREEPPYHIVFPAMHLTRDEIKDVFQRKLGDAPSNNPEELTMVARRVLREKYLQADVGITGANFAIAETGMISITENEGNARLTAALPRTMITLVGHREGVAAARRPRAVSADAGGDGHGPDDDVLQHPVWRPAPAGRSGRPGGISRGAARQPPHRPAGRCRAARLAALHPLRRVPQRLPDLPQRRRPHLRHDLLRAHWRGHHAEPARAATIGSTFPTPPRFAAPAPRPAR